MTTSKPGHPEHPDGRDDDHGRCSMPSGSLDKIISGLKKAGVTSSDLAHLEKVVEGLMKKVAGKDCGLKNGKIPTKNTEIVVTEVLKSLINQKSCLCH